MVWLMKLVRDAAVNLRLMRKPDLLAVQVSAHPDPEAMKPGVLYVVGSPEFQKWAVFRCPTNENDIIQLSLMPNRRPRWQVTVDLLERPTIYPSVRQLDGARSHFWVDSGCVQWCADTGRAPSYDFD